MTGGLMQIVTYGTQDLFLTGAPQITFFKIVYRRYTNFSIEPMRQSFDGIIDFDRKVSATFSKNGDLVHKAYLNIQLPDVNIVKENYDPNAATEYQIRGGEVENRLNIFNAFMVINTEAYRRAFAKYNPYRNSETVETEANFMINSVIDTFTEKDPYGIISTTTRIMVGDDVLFNQVSLLVVVNNLKTTYLTQDKFITHDAIQAGMDAAVALNKEYYDAFVEVMIQTRDLENKYAQFAWVKKLGHAIVDTIDVFIGGQKIDRHYGDWLNIWYELNKNYYQQDNYNKMIGDVDILTSFDREKKPTYELSIPLQFWFCRHSGLALPLVALQYHDVQMEVKFRRVIDCCYIDETATLFDKIKMVDAYLSLDYIYLDSDERKRFAQSNHEYLIEQLQLYDFDVTKVPAYKARVFFEHPVKEMIWTYQLKDFYDINYSENVENWWHLYAMYVDDYNEPYLNPIKNAMINFNGAIRMIKMEGNYFNYVQPLEKHSSTPADGINVYSFSFKPEEQQPSGSCDMSRLENVELAVEFEDDAIVDNGGKLRIYATNYNILRIFSGFAGLAYAS